MTSPSARNATRRARQRTRSGAGRCSSRSRSSLGRVDGRRRPDIAGSSAADDRHAEETDRQRVEQLRVGQSGDGAGRQQAGEQRVDVGADLHDAAADEHRHEIADDGPHVLGPRSRREAQVAARPAARPGAARANCSALPTTDPQASSTASRGSAARRRTRPACAIIAAFQITGAEVRQQEAVVAVENAEAPRRQHEQAGAREQDAHERDRQLALLAGEARRDDAMRSRRRDDAEQHERPRRPARAATPRRRRRDRPRARSPRATSAA